MMNSDHQVTSFHGTLVGTNRLIEKYDWETKRPAVIKSSYRLSQSLQNDTPPLLITFLAISFLDFPFSSMLGMSLIDCFTDMTTTVIKQISALLFTRSVSLIKNETFSYFPK